MFPFTIRMHLRTLLIAFLISLTYGHDRQIISKLNPGCLDCDNSTTLVYIKADGSHDTIHQIWDFTKGLPTVIYTIASLNSTMSIHWNGMAPDKFELSEAPIYSFATTIDKLYEYDDCFDRGHIDHRCPERQWSLRRVTWKRVNSILTDKEAMVRMRGRYDDWPRTGIVEMRLDLLPFEDYAVDLPHLIHTANSTLIDVSLVNFTTSSDFNASRFALHFVMASTDSRSDSMNYTMRKSLDDEHTPGVFEIIEIRTPRSRTAGSGGFIQFRPVGYTEPERSVSSSTNAYISTFNRTSLPQGTTMWRFYEKFERDNLLLQDMFISFGLPGDGYYRQHNYTSWSFTYGYGSPPIESVSLFVIIIISIGLGVPFLLAMSGITYVIVRRYKQRNQPTRFTDDE
ncbi:glycosylated lysosomal membrane protein B-like [Anticarsia gemmatalis]|uniref:glycosylated lysosomal membrane protein B-like n=1 Tax=Anticarsia gemmatalis TaxID=129554 RepID=UPI003F774719